MKRLISGIQALMLGAGFLAGPTLQFAVDQPIAVEFMQTAQAGVPKTSVTIVARTDGQLDSTCKEGGCDPEPAELAWNNELLETLLTGALTMEEGDPQVSIDLRQALTGVASDTSTIALVQKTGTAIAGYITEPLTGDFLLGDCDTPPAAGTFRVRAVIEPGVGVSSDDTFSWDCAASQSAGEINFNPGIYWQAQRSGQVLDPNYRRDTLYPAIFTAGNSAFRGFALPIRWKDVECTSVGVCTQGNVTPGVNLINAELNTLRHCPGASPVWCNPDRRLWIQWEDDKQNITIANYEQVFPTYLGQAPMGGPNTATHKYGVYERLAGVDGTKPTIYWDQSNANAYAAFANMWTQFITALKAGPNWDLIEGFRLGQEYGSDEFGGSGPTRAEFDAYMRNYAALIRSLAPDKAVIVNSLDGMVDYDSFIDYLETIDVLPGHGDTVPCKPKGNTDDCMQDDGKTQSQILQTMPTGDKNLIGTGPDSSDDRRVSTRLWMAAEGSELGQCVFETYSLQDIYDFVNFPMQAVYFLIDTYNGNPNDCTAHNPPSPASDSHTRAEIKAFFEANPSLDNTSPPPNYP